MSSINANKNKRKHSESAENEQNRANKITNSLLDILVLDDTTGCQIEKKIIILYCNYQINY
jgi:hypothetical protein